MYEVTALVPMKAHSERVPNKNIRAFAGKPLFHHILNTLENTRYIDTIVINTDSHIIREQALSFDKVRINERPVELRGDMISMNNIIAYDIAKCETEHFLQTHSTNPLLSSTTLEKAIETYFDNLDRNDSLFSVTAVQSRLYWKDSKPINHNLSELIRTQDLPKVYEENSCIYIFSKKTFNDAGGRRIGLKPKMLQMERLEAIDIDEEEDFIIAELLYKNISIGNN